MPLVQEPEHHKRQLHICKSLKKRKKCKERKRIAVFHEAVKLKPPQLLINEIYPIERRRNVGAKPRNIEVSRDKRPFAENNGRTIEKPIIQKLTGELR